MSQPRCVLTRTRAFRSWTTTNGNGAGSDRAVAIQVNGGGGGQWVLGLREGQVRLATPGLGPQGTPRFYMSTDTFAALAQGARSVADSVNRWASPDRGNQRRRSPIR